MLNNITLRQYFPGSSPLHRLDPRTKILLTVAYLVCVFLVKSFWGFAAITLFIGMCSYLSGIHIKFLVRGVKPILLIVVFTFILNLFFNSSGQVLVKWWIFTVTKEGLRNAVFMAVRLILLVTGTQILTLTTSPHVILTPCIAVMICVLSFNLVGNGLRDALRAGRRG